MTKSDAGTGPPEDGAKVAVVTGASSGIGAATALRLAGDGYRVHAMARRAERLEHLVDASQGRCQAHVVDVRHFESLADLLSGLGPIDVLVNNAGLGRVGTTLADGSPDDINRSVDTNVTAMLVACQAALPAMIERRLGHVVNIGSMAGLYPTSGAVYGATKAAVSQLSSNLRLELRGTGVRVTEICPGRVSTEFYDVAIDDPTRRAAVKESGIDEVSAEDVADAIAYAVGVAPNVNINRIELQPTEQTYGGVSFDPIRPAGERS